MQASPSTTPHIYHFCTYFDRNYLTRGLALYESLRRTCHKPFVLWVLCFDEETHAVLSRLQLPSMELIPQSEFEAGDAELVAAKEGRSRVEYYWTCTPSLPLYVLAQHPEVEIITYLDADLYFFSDPQPIYDEMGSASIVIIEHHYAPENAHLATKSGIYNVGWLSFRRDANGLSCLHWWRERCLEWCYKYYEDGKFGDQLYLDDWPQRFSDLVVLQHRGAGLAPWNLNRYHLHFIRNRATVDGQPLIFYHFHEKIVERTGQISITGYQLSSQHIKWLYLPYIVALKRAERQASAGGQGIGWLRSHFWFVAPVWLEELIWRFNGWRLENWTLEELADRRFAAGEYGQARNLLLRLIRRNPLVLRRKSVIVMIMHADRSDR